MPQHSEYRYSATIATDDEALLNCLRALSHYAQQTGNTRIPSGGTKRSDWDREAHCVTFRFSHPRYRQAFLGHIERLFARDLYDVIGTSDADPASPQAD
jgi:hypothetical protein